MMKSQSLLFTCVSISRKRYNLNSTLKRYNLQEGIQYNTERGITSTALYGGITSKRESQQPQAVHCSRKTEKMPTTF